MSVCCKIGVFTDDDYYNSVYKEAIDFIHICSHKNKHPWDYEYKVEIVIGEKHYLVKGNELIAATKNALRVS